MSALVFLIILAIIGSCFYSGAETVLISVSKVKLRYWADNRLSGGRLALDYLERSDQIIGSVLVGNNIMLVSATVVAAKLIESFLLEGTIANESIKQFANNDLVLAILIPLVVTPFILLFGEIMPKAFGRQHANVLFPLISLPLRLSNWLFLPIIWIATRVAGLILKSLGINVEASKKFFSRRNVEILLKESENEGIVKSDEGDIIAGVFEFGDTLVKEVMTSRTNIVAVKKGTQLDGIASTMLETGFSRIPVYERNLDNVIGIVHLLDVIDQISGLTIKPRPAIFVPETKKCDDLLREMRSRKSHMAIALDEYGGTAGLITMEDLVEELVGEIQDEHDHELVPEEASGRSRMELDARTELSEVNERLGLSLDYPGVDTIGGFLTSSLGRIPSRGEKFELDDLEIEVLDATDNRVIKMALSSKRNVS